MPAEPDASPLVLADVNLPTLADTRHAGADALVLAEGRIRAVGRWSELRRTLPTDAAVRDLAGATALPGLGDAHVHFTATGYLQTALDAGRVGTRTELLDAIRARAGELPPGSMVLGLRLDHQSFPDGRPPSREELTAAAPDHPVYIRHVTGHSSVVNDAALAILDFLPGQKGVDLDAEGRPTGTLIAQATQLATQVMYARYSSQVSYESAFRAAAASAVAQGCTTLHALDDLDAVRVLMRTRDALPLRVEPYTQSFDLQAVLDLGLRRIGGCHGCALDGDFDMGTAATLEPYEGRPGHYGVLYHNHLTLDGFVMAAHQAHVQLCFHAVGDRAVEQALRAFEKAQAAYPYADARHRIEHAQLMTREQMRRARDVGAVVSVQPAFNHVWDHATYPDYLGHRADVIDPIGSLVEEGLHLAGGSDSTVTELRPLLGIHAAVNHSRPEERIGVGQAIEMFSTGIAYSTFDEGRRGRIRPGFDADLTIVDRDPFAVDPTALESIRPAMTVVGGSVAYEV